MRAPRRRRSNSPALTREHELTMYGAFGAFLEGWASAAGGAPGGGLADMRRAVDELREQNVLLFDGLLKIALAEAEAGQAIPTAPSRSSTKRWRRPTAPATARSKRNCIGHAAKSC